MLWLRKIVFYIFAFVYLILCPLIVARMLGFVINPQTHQLVKTGLVYISTNPPGATLYVDGRLAHEKTPAALHDLTPGEHFLRIELNGYNDWERNIPIAAKKATVLANTLLIPEEWPIKEISSKSYQNIIPAGDGILIAVNPVLKNIDLFHTTLGIEEDLKEENTYQQSPLFSRNSVYAEGSLVHIYHAPQNPFLLIEANIKDKHKFLWIHLKENPPLIEDISDLFPQLPSRIVWSSTDNENILAFYPPANSGDAGSIYRINVKDKAIYPQRPDKLPPEADSGEGVQDKFLINDKNDLLVREGKSIRIYPKEDFGAIRAYNIAASRPSTNMYFEEKNGELFYLDNDSQSLYAAQILPYHPILNIPIPDALRSKFSSQEPET